MGGLGGVGASPLDEIVCMCEQTVGGRPPGPPTLGASRTTFSGSTPAAEVQQSVPVTTDRARHTHPPSRALHGIRICDMSGQLAGAGATRLLASLGAQVIRVEDPVRQGLWDILRGSPPFADEQRGIDVGGAFNNHNTEKLGITLDLRRDEGKALLRRLVAVSDVVTENFAAGVMARLGFDYEALEAIRPGIIYVSNCGFGHTGPYHTFKTWGPIVQANCGLTFASALEGQPPAGWGFSYMDHMGANFMALAVVAALVHRNRTGEGQWVDMSCVEAGATLFGPETLDVTVNGRPSRRPDRPSSNRSNFPAMAPHGIYPAAGEDDWVAVACRDDGDWGRLAPVVGVPVDGDARFDTLEGRLRHQDELDERIGRWTQSQARDAIVARIKQVGVPVSIVARPEDRIEHDPATAEWGLWPAARHTKMGDIRVDGVPVHLSESDWAIEQAAPCLGEDNDYVLGELLGCSPEEIAHLREERII